VRGVRGRSSDDSPTPGYMYGEIAKMTMASFEACKQIEEYVIRRVEKKNATVKWKTLLLIKHVARSGRAEFRRDLCRQLGPIKECLTFSGPPDALRGDEMYVKVREAAKEALEAVTSSEGPSQTAAAYGGRIEGYGSEPSSAPPPAQYGGSFERYNEATTYAAATSRYEGYGNTPAARQPETYMERAAALATGLKDKVADAAASLATRDGGYVGGSDRVAGTALPGGRMAGFGNPNFSDARLEKQTSWSEKTSAMARRAGNAVRNIGFKNDMKEDLSSVYASNRGATPYVGSEEGSYHVPEPLAAASYEQPAHHQTWGRQLEDPPAPPPPQQPQAAGPPRQKGAVGGVWGAMPQQHHSQPHSAAPTSQRAAAPKSVGAANRDGEYERQLVSDLCAEGGTRAAPPADKLEDFVSAAATLDPEVVGPNLLDLLDNERPAQVKAKALAVVAALASAPGCEQHRAYFADVAADLAYLAETPPLVVQKNARKMLAALGELDAAVERDARRLARRAPTQQDATFGGDDDATLAPEPDPPVAAIDDAPDLLGGYGDDEPDEQPPVPPEPPQPPQPGGGLFDDLALKTPADAPPDVFLPTTGSEPPLDPFAAAEHAEPSNGAPPPPVVDAPPQQPREQQPALKAAPALDPFSTLGELGDLAPTPAPATGPATGPAFVATAHATPAYTHQQMLQQKQMQMNAQMVALMHEQHRLAAQQRQLHAAYASYPAAAYQQQPQPSPLVPDLAAQSAFSFMTTDAKAKQNDSFAFVSDMMK